MLYNIPYNQNFLESLAQKVMEHADDRTLVILPGQYLTDKCKNIISNISCISYDDLWFHILPNRVSAVTENMIMDKVINNTLEKSKIVNSAMRNALKSAINEFFYYGIEFDQLQSFSGSQELFSEVMSELLALIQKNHIALKMNTLYVMQNHILDIQKYLKQYNRIYMILPIVVSPILFKLLKIFYEQLTVYIVLQGFEKIEYDLGCEHPNFYLQKFLQTLEKNDIYNLSGPMLHHTEINNCLIEIMIPPHLLYLWHTHKLYDLNHVKVINSNSPSAECLIILQSLLEYIKIQKDSTKICIVTKNTDKAKILFKYLSTYLGLSNTSINTSIPFYCSDYTDLKLFYTIIDFAGNKNTNILTIFNILKYSIQYNLYKNDILKAEKFLLESDNFNPHNIKFIKNLLQTNNFNTVVDCIDMILQIKYNLVHGISQDIASDNNNFLYILNAPSDTKCIMFLQSHISYFLSLVDITIISKQSLYALKNMLKETLNTLLTLQTCISDFTEYRYFIMEVFNNYIISDITTHINTLKLHNIDILTNIEARFLAYNLTIICDLQEDIWPSNHSDHYFISTYTREYFQYMAPMDYETGCEAHDFISLIGASEHVIISYMNQVITQDNTSKKAIMSRFLSLLYSYNIVSGFKNDLSINNITSTQPSIDLHLNKYTSLNILNTHKIRTFSSTSIEKLFFNPYLYAIKYSLKLNYLPKSCEINNTLPTNKEFGLIVHYALHKAANIEIKDIDFSQYKKHFLNIIYQIIETQYPMNGLLYHKLWHHKINTIVEFIYEYNIALGKQHDWQIHTKTEQNIAIDINITDDITIKLHAYADRIDYAAGMIYICDYKTGQIPTMSDIKTGLKPQLLLEGMIIHLNNLEKNTSHEIILRYIRLTGINTTNDIKDIHFDFSTTFNGISNILKLLYINNIPYITTNEYKNYLQGHFMRTLDYIEHKY